jgi:DNA-binding winged helix-turn-helix (wHTH) protein/Tol biopolymer transport system component
MDDTFSFGRFQVFAARRELWADGRPAAIGARALDVLIALLRRPGELVTKDDLLTAVWAGVAVEDNAIAAQISAIRRALGEGVDGARYVQTVSGRGYRFVATLDVAPSGEQRPAAAPPLSPRRPGSSLLGAGLAAGLAGLALTAVAALWLTNRGWAIDGMEMFASSPLVETDAAPSPNGEMIAYAAGPERSSRRIFLKSLSGGEPLAFTPGGADDFAPAWSPTGDRIAFVRAADGQPCALLVKPFPAGAERVVARCRSMARTIVTWAKTGDALYFHDRGAADAPNRILRLDIASGRVSPVTQPPAGSDGDHGAMLSPSGRWLAFERETDALPVVTVRELATGAEHSITGKALNTAGAAWADDHALVVATERPDDSALWLYSVGGGAPRRLTFNPAEFSRVVSNGAGLFGFESHTFRHDLAYASPTAAETPKAIEPGPGLVNGLAYARDGSLAYAQAQAGSGPWDVWVKRPGRPAEQLTNLKASYLEAPRWSPDGRRIAFMATIGLSPAIYVVGADGSGLRRLTARSIWMGGPEWTPDGAGLIYPLLQGRDWGLWRVEVDHAGPPRALNLHGWYSVRSDGRDLYAVSAAMGGVWRLGDAPRLIAREVRVEHAMDWDVVGGRLAFLDRSGAGAARLIIRAVAGGADRTFWAPAPMVAADDDLDGQGGIGGVSLDPRTGKPVYVHVTDDHSDVGVFRLVRR